MELDERALYYWDPVKALVTRADGTKDKWENATGISRIFVGASSRDLRLEGEIKVRNRQCRICLGFAEKDGIYQFQLLSQVSALLPRISLQRNYKSIEDRISI